MFYVNFKTMKMKNVKMRIANQFAKSIPVVVLCALFNACGNDDSTESFSGKTTLTQVVNTTFSTTDEEILPAENDSVLLEILHNSQTRSAKRGLMSLSYEDADDYFDENIYQLRELPLIIQARGTGNKSNKFLSCDGAGKEVGLVPSASSNRQCFYLRILPASAGIPYLIYSDASKTPLSVGYYRKNPDKKILYARQDNNGSLFMAAWDLKACDYQGYFAITSNDYIGRSDPNNTWSIFYYTIEAQDENKIGYAKYSKKAQQEFLIQPRDSFTVDYIDFDKSSAKISKRNPLEVVSYGKNETEERRPFKIVSAHYATNTSRFSEKSILKIPFGISKYFYSPKVEAEHVVVPSPVKPEDLEQSGFEKNIQYTNNTQNMPTILKVEIDGNAKPNSLIEVTSWLENYNVSVNYTAYMSYKYKEGDVRTVKIRGTWYGTLYTKKRAKPDVIKFFDLNDGEELSLMKTKNITISKTLLK